MTVTIAAVDPNPYEVTLRVRFDGDMLVDSNFTKVTNYQFNNGMYARYTEVPSISVDGYATYLILWVELFYASEDFTLTVSNLKDSYNNDVSDTFDFSSYRSSAHITNYNGLVRTWHNSNFIQADSQRIYLATLGGIDVFNKTSPSAINKWGQIFDSYGVDAMFVSNYGGDYRFSDSGPPVLYGLDPSSGSFWDNVGPVTIGVLDIDTAVRITSLVIYINDAYAFNGRSGGFVNNYYGNVLIGYRSLLAVIYPPSFYPDGSEITVRVMATDLLNNRLDTTYYFTIGAGGFGVGAFGIFAFGS